MAKISIAIGKNSRSCDSCTKCCEGWLSANINGEDMYPGKPCQNVKEGVGCMDYKNRPKEPCKTFECAWRATDYVPKEFSPTATGQIVVPQEVNGIPYLSMIYAGKEVEPGFLSWFVTFAVGRQLNAEWSVDGQLHSVGSSDFIQARRAQLNLIGGSKNETV